MDYNRTPFYSKSLSWNRKLACRDKLYLKKTTEVQHRRLVTWIGHHPAVIVNITHLTRDRDTFHILRSHPAEVRQSFLGRARIIAVHKIARYHQTCASFPRLKTKTGQGKASDQWQHFEFQCVLWIYPTASHPRVNISSLYLAMYCDYVIGVLF